MPQRTTAGSPRTVAFGDINGDSWPDMVTGSAGPNNLTVFRNKGDGTFDVKDLYILNGIGKWMNTNGASIYGTTASGLPLQNWGVSTLKNNKLYLHVFHLECFPNYLLHM